jgi:ADP-ribosylglycohydrolase
VAAVESLGGGWVGEEALAIGLYAVLSAESYVEAIRIATNHSGDSDSK